MLAPPSDSSRGIAVNASSMATSSAWQPLVRPMNACLTLDLHACCSPWAGTCCPQSWRSRSGCSSRAKLGAPGTFFTRKPSPSSLSSAWPGGCSSIPTDGRLLACRTASLLTRRDGLLLGRGLHLWVISKHLCCAKGCNKDLLSPCNKLSRHQQASANGQYKVLLSHGDLGTS